MPNRPQYGVFDIALFHHFGSTDPRKEFQALFGVQSPPFNPAKRVKLWLDTSKGDDPNTPVVYDILTIDKSGAPVYAQQMMSAAEASTPNIPGDFIYDHYVLKPTGAQLRLPMAAFPVDPAELSTEEDAIAMVKMLQPKLPNMSLKAEEVILGSGSAYIYPADEPRRVRNIVDSVTGNSIGNVGEFYFYMYKDGIGFPGHWQIGNLGQPEWVREFPPNHPTDPALTLEWPMPVRQLQTPPEKLVLSFGSTITIQRTDLLPLPSTGGNTSAGKDYTDGDRQRDNETHAWMMSLAKKLAL